MSARSRLAVVFLLALSPGLIHCLVRFSEREPSDRLCGNGTLDVGEACDDGNHRSHDGCSSGCTVETLGWSRLPVDQAAPPGRLGHAMVFSPAGERVLLFGGLGENGVLNDTWAFDGATWGELDTPTAPPPRTDHAMVYDLVRQRVVLFGGRDESYNTMGDTWVLEGGTWRQLNPLATTAAPSGRFRIAGKSRSSPMRIDSS